MRGYTNQGIRREHGRHFQSAPGDLSRTVVPRIAWSRANLVEGAEIRDLVRVPFIFCRNVFIYFAEETISRTVRVFSHGMVRPGYLFVGAAESLLKLTD